MTVKQILSANIVGGVLLEKRRRPGTEDYSTKLFCYRVTVYTHETASPSLVNGTSATSHQPLLESWYTSWWSLVKGTSVSSQPSWITIYTWCVPQQSPRPRDCKHTVQCNATMDPPPPSTSTLQFTDDQIKIIVYCVLTKTSIKERKHLHWPSRWRPLYKLLYHLAPEECNIKLPEISKGISKESKQY
jgi:hypothetical protein